LEKRKNKIKLKDIAEIAGVSVGTVDRVIHARKEVNEKTREKVLSIINELGYKPNLQARSLALKKTHHIIALIPSGKQSDNSYWDLPKTGIEKAARELDDYFTDVEIRFFNSIEKESFTKQAEAILKEKPDGVVFSPFFKQPSLTFSKKLNTAGIPYVFIDSNFNEANAISYFGQDTFQSGYLSARIMSYGLRKNDTILIVNLTNTESVISHLKLRQEGFLAAIMDDKKKFNPVTINIDLSNTDEPDLTLKKSFEENPHVKGIFVPNSRVYKVAKYLCNIGKCNTLLVGYDLIEENVEYLNKGYIDFLICQKPEEQGYKSVMALSKYILTKEEIPRVNYSQIDIITKENLNYYNNI
jgi:LacI family transcriptional regulator